MKEESELRPVRLMCAHLSLWFCLLSAYKDAAEKYEEAWKYMNEVELSMRCSARLHSCFLVPVKSSPSVGYKLALTYLKGTDLSLGLLG
jgi:hypothetical protein